MARAPCVYSDGTQGYKCVGVGACSVVMTFLSISIGSHVAAASDIIPVMNFLTRL